MLNYKLKIGILPIRRNIKEPPKRIGIFQSDYAVENKNNAIIPKNNIGHSSFINNIIVFNILIPSLYVESFEKDPSGR